MANADRPGTIYSPLLQTSSTFVQNSLPSKIFTGPEILTHNGAFTDTITTPVISVIIDSAINGKQTLILNVLDITTNNTISYDMPMSNLTFVLGPDDDDEPAIGPMDVITIFAIDKFDNFEGSKNLPSPDALSAANRIFTGLVHEFHDAWNTHFGKAYNIIFTTNIKKFDVTTEYRDLQILQGTGTFRIPATVAESFASKQAPPGEFIRDACAQSNVKFAYIYDPIDKIYDPVSATQKNNTAPNQAAIFSGDGFRDPSLFPDGVATDAYGQITEFKRLFWKSNLLHWFNPVDHQFQTWLRVLADIIAGAFLEVFFTRFGLLYARNIGMFLPAGRWDFQIDPSVIIDYDDFENDETIVTRLQIDWDFAQLNLPFQPYVWGAQNYSQLERIYGPRYKIIQAPWAVYTSVSSANPTPASSNQIFEYLRDYASVYMALSNSNAVRGKCTLLGFSNLEVGQTIYFPHKNRVFYIEQVSHRIEAGGRWTTSLGLTYGRPKEADLINYINQRAVILGMQAASGGDITTSSNSGATNPGTIPSNPDSSSIYSGGNNLSILSLFESVKGAPYILGSAGGRSNFSRNPPPSSFDCSGFVAWIYYNLSNGQVQLPAFTDSIANSSLVQATSNPQAGDLVLYQFNDPGQPGVRFPHVAIFQDFNTVIQCGGSYTNANSNTVNRANLDQLVNPTYFHVIDNIDPPGSFFGSSNAWVKSGPTDIVISSDNLIQSASGASFYDPSFQYNVKKYAQAVINSLGFCNVNFFIAQAIHESAWGKNLGARWNYAGVAGSNPRPFNNYQDYTDPNDAASGIVKTINNGNYTEFIQYCKTVIPFSATQAAALLYAKWSGSDQGRANAIADISQLYDQLNNPAFTWQN